MGSSSSKAAAVAQEDPKTNKLTNFVDTVKQGVEDELAKKLMFQREIQIAVNVAKARDTLMIFGSAWSVLVTGAVTAQLAGKPVPPLVGVPVVIGGLVLGNMADMAYGNKLNRVTKEAEYILAHERGRLVPPQQAAFAKFYTPAERAEYHVPATAVSALYPNALFVASRDGSSSSEQ